MSEIINGRRMSLRNKNKHKQMPSLSVRLNERYGPPPSNPAPLVEMKKMAKKKPKKTNMAIGEKKKPLAVYRNNEETLEVKKKPASPSLVRVSFGKTKVQVLFDESMSGEPSPTGNNNNNNNKENNSDMSVDAMGPCSNRKSFASSVGVESDLSFEFAETQQDAPELCFNIIN